MPFINSVRGSFGAQSKLRNKNNRGFASTGGLITLSGGYRIHTFSTVGSSTFVPGEPMIVEYLIVAGGGGTGWDVGGGGGAGGLLSGNLSVAATSYNIVVGDGGNSHPANTGDSRGQNGGNSSAFSLTAIGGGGGGSYPNQGTGLSGGSGGGGGQQPFNAAGGSGTTGQGFAGGASSGGSWGSGGGGGAGGVGSTGITGQAVDGGAPVSSSISGSSVFYAGGGYGNSDSGVVYATGTNRFGTQVGFYGFGSNGTGPSGLKANPGIVIIRYPV